LRRSAWLAAAISPLTAPLVFVVGRVLLDTSPKENVTWEIGAYSLLIAIPFSYISSYLFGAPLIYLLKRKTKYPCHWAISLSAPLGVIAVICLYLLTVAIDGPQHLERETVAYSFGGGVTLGLVVAFSFCLLGGITMPSTGREKSALR